MSAVLPLIMDPEVETRHASPGMALLHFSAGGSIGALLGLCMGLSVSPVVAAVLTALGTGLLALLGLKGSPGHATAGTHAHINSLRVLGFGLVAVIALGGGLLIRTHGWLSPSLSKQRTDLKEAGFTDSDIRHILLRRQFAPQEAGAQPDPVSERDELKQAGFSDAETHGILLYRELGLARSANPEAKSKSGDSKSESPSAPAALASAIPSVLYGATADDCLKLDPRQYANVDAFLASLRNRKGKFETLAINLGKLNPAERGTAAQAFYEFSCQ